MCGYVRVVPRPVPDSLPELVSTMKRSLAALRGDGIEVVLGGGLAVWARGGPATEHDVDLFVRERDAERALASLAALGFRTERPPEGWLFKTWHGDILVDLIFDPAGGPVDDPLFERAEWMEVMAQPALVAAVDDVLVSKLLALAEHDLDYRPVLEVARSLREQVSWEDVRRRTGASPFAAAFLTLVETLGIASPLDAETPPLGHVTPLRPRGAGAERSAS